jgi:hypothetical protein
LKREPARPPTDEEWAEIRKTVERQARNREAVLLVLAVVGITLAVVASVLQKQAF